MSTSRQRIEGECKRLGLYIWALHYERDNLPLPDQLAGPGGQWVLTVIDDEHRYFAGSVDEVIAELGKTFVAPPTDAERLDFLDAMSIDVDDMKREGAEPGRAVVFFAPYDGDRPDSIREAIDRAMRKAGDANELR